MVVVPGGKGRPGRLVRLVRWLLASVFWRAVRRIGLGERHEWFSLPLVWLTLSVAVWSIEQAQWIEPQPSLLAALAAAVLAGHVLVRTGWRTAVVYMVMAVLGLAVVVWQTIGLFVAPEVDSALTLWWQAIAGPPSEGTIYFAMFLVLITWVFGFAATWFVLRRRNAWPAVAFGSLTVLVNLSNLHKEDYLFLPLFLLTALLLVGQVNLAKQGAWFGRHSARYSYRGMAYLAGAVVFISLVTVIAAWLVPAPPVEQIQLAAFGGGSRDGGGSWYNIFADVQGKWTIIDSDQRSEMLFSDPLSTRPTIQFIVTADRAAYWRTWRFDTYHAWGWTSDGAVSHDSSHLLPPPESGDAEMVAYSVETRLKTDIVLTLGEFVSASLPVEVFAFGGEDVGDIDGRATGTDEASDGPDMITIGDVIAVVTPRFMRPYQRYTVTARISLPTAEELSQAGDKYPEEILDRYLQLPPDLPQRVLTLAADLTDNVETDYDKVLAIKEHVLGLSYNIEAEPTPEDTDAVDYFLFESREGVCTEFASALAVMLRVVGVPTRFTTGYLEGDYEEETGSYILRVSDYHARTEVYFPEYGWIEFSATPVGGSIGTVVADSVGDSIGISDLGLMPVENIPFGPDFETLARPGEATSRRSPSGPKFYVYLVVVGVLAVVVLAARSGYSMWVVSLKRVSDPIEAYERMCRLASWGKAGPMAQETPLEYCARLALALPQQTASIETIGQAYIETQFSTRRQLGRLEKGRLQNAWVNLVPDLLRGLPRLWRESA